MVGPNSRVWYTLVGVWLSDKTLFLVFNILLLGVWMSNETLLIVFDIFLLGVLDISYETVFSCLTYCFLLFRYVFGCLDIRWNTPSRVWCITSPCLDIRWNTPSCVSHITSLCSEIRWTTCVYSWVLCIVFVSLCKGNRRSNFESLSSHLSKYEDSIPLADRNRNNLLALARMNNYL